ncbi:FAD-dependent monooxygenase [Micromonospora carbonacea]|uniref:FAD-dependent monooxygenase n=1 Tax=Micromonospora carbonacea TaxID=47853 RepID=UPI0037103FE2
MATIDKGKRALIVGLGIAGISTAIRLRSIGWEPVIVERASARRGGGYFLGVFGAGQDAARRLNILDAIPDRVAADTTTFVVNRTGGKRRGLGFTDLPVRLRCMLRGDVERGAFSALPDDVEIRYSTSPTRIEQDDDGVDVTLEQDGVAGTERFDLVVGADGMRSTVRRLAFGPHEQFLHPLGYMVAACLLPHPIAGMGPHEGATLLEPGRALWIFPMEDHPPSAFFSYRTDDVDREFSGRPVDRLRAAFGPQEYGRLLGAALDVYEAAEQPLFDSAEQVRMRRWSTGRVVLVGDAAWCLTVFSGMGVSSAMAGADVLGTMLQRHGDRVVPALQAWEGHLRRPIESYQRAGVDMIPLFTPETRRQIKVRHAFEVGERLPLIGQALRWISRGEHVEKDQDIALVQHDGPALVGG